MGLLQEYRTHMPVVNVSLARKWKIERAHDDSLVKKNFQLYNFMLKLCV